MFPLYFNAIFKYSESGYGLIFFTLFLLQTPNDLTLLLQNRLNKVKFHLKTPLELPDLVHSNSSL